MNRMDKVHSDESEEQTYESLANVNSSIDSTLGDTKFKRTIMRIGDNPSLLPQEVGMMMTWNPAKVDEEIANCQKVMKNYKTLMYMVSSNTGWFAYVNLVLLYYLKETLKESPDTVSIILNYTGTAWMIKPVFGFLSDSFFPFGYRFKSHIIGMCLLHIGLSLLLFFWKEPQADATMYLFIFSNICVAYIDTLAEGISSVVTKMEERIKGIKFIKTCLGDPVEEEEDTSMRAFGNFNSIRTLFKSTMIFVGGYSASKVSINVSGLIMGFYPIIMLLFTLFVFKEEKKKVFFNGVSKFWTGLKQTFKVFLMPENVKPFTYMFISVLPPSFFTMYRFLMLGRGGWNYVDLAANNFCIGIIYASFFLYFVNTIKNANTGKLMQYGMILYGFSAIFYFWFFFISGYSIWMTFTMKFFFDLLGNFSSDLLSVPVIGQISKHLPEGFESTGITIMISMINFAGFINGMLSAHQTKAYDAEKAGFYDRAKAPLLFNLGCMIFLIIIGPLFLAKLSKKKKKLM